MPTLRDVLEAAIVENPDDLAAHMAYADHLHDLGDPRGELIQVQLALDDASRPAEERRRLQAREKELLKGLADAIVGKGLVAVRALDPHHGIGLRTKIARGWLDDVEVASLAEALSVELACAPEARLLRRLAVLYLLREEFRPPEEKDVVALLTGTDNLRNLRVLHLGQTDGFRADQGEPIVYNSRWDLYQAGDPIWDWIARLPRLEELYLECFTLRTERLFGMESLGNLRILQVNLSTDYPLVALGRNRALTNLTHLSFHPAAAHTDEGDGAFLSVEQLTGIARSPHLKKLTHLRFQRSDAGDTGVRVLIESGLLKRLKFLDLAMGEVTDEGAGLLAEADLGGLEYLDLRANALSQEGQRRLGQAVGKKLALRTDNQHAEDDQDWLTYGEME